MIAIVSEFLCTFIFMFAVCGAGINQNNMLTHSWAVSGIITTLVATAVTLTFGAASGAHFNPAVTVGLTIAGKIDPILAIVYILEQLLASTVATVAIRWLYQDGDVPEELLIQRPSDDVSWGAATAMEALLSFILVFVILATVYGYQNEKLEHRATLLKKSKNGADLESPDEESPIIGSTSESLTPKDDEERIHERLVAVLKRALAPFAVGSTLGFLCYIGGSVSGGAFNPARVTGPAIIAVDFKDLEIYWIGDCLGASIAAAFYLVMYTGIESV